MSSVVHTMAAETACNIAVLDFDTQESERRLFKGISKLDTPVYEGGQRHTVTQDGIGNAAEFSTTVHLQSGDKYVQVDFLNYYFNQAENDARELFLHQISVHASGGQLVAQIDLEFFDDISGASVDIGCGGPFSAVGGSAGDSRVLHDAGTICRYQSGDAH